jgi:mannose-6-phosphate isomerase-like protein (cupin superfamily)
MSGVVRRVVTGHDENGKGVVISDGPAPYVHSTPIRPGYFSTDIFRTFETPALIKTHQEETTLGPRRQLPTKAGSVLRINHFPPEPNGNEHLDLQASKALFESLGNAAGSSFEKNGRHPLMHRTETIDYAIILSGEITMLLDDSEVLLKAGDILIQCGTDHAWTNRSNAPCVVAFILIDGEYDETLSNIVQSHEK